MPWTDQAQSGVEVPTVPDRGYGTSVVKDDRRFGIDHDVLVCVGRPSQMTLTAAARKHEVILGTVWLRFIFQAPGQQRPATVLAYRPPEAEAAPSRKRRQLYYPGQE